MKEKLSFYAYYLPHFSAEQIVECFAHAGVREDEIAAKAMGVPNRRIIFAHILPNALVPIVTVVGLTTGWAAFGEQLLPVHFAGAGLLMAGLVVNVCGGPLWSDVMGRLRAAR